MDVGQGDAALVIEPFQKSVVMIDAAGSTSKNLAKDVLLPLLRSRRLNKIDALIVTHQDFDHAGSRDQLTASWKVKKVIEDRNDIVPVDYPFYSLLPDRDVQEENDQSIVNWFEYDGFGFLWTGDASVSIEAGLLSQYALQADVLKAGHHGSKTSSSQAFLQEVDPQVALISAGYKNRYGHPHPSVMNRLLQLGIDNLQTAKQGMITIKTWKNWMWIICADGTISCLQHGHTFPKLEAAAKDLETSIPDSIDASAQEPAAEAKNPQQNRELDCFGWNSCFGRLLSFLK